jgi:hypothetical protein
VFGLCAHVLASQAHYHCQSSPQTASSRSGKIDACNINLSIHHPEFGVILKEKLDAVGVENAMESKDDGSDPKLMVEFLIRHLEPVPPAP